MVKAIKIFVLFAAAAGLIAASGYPKKLNNKALEKQMVPIGKAIWMSKHKGGSWENNASSIQIHAADPYAGISKAHPCIGFRVVAKQAYN